MTPIETHTLNNLTLSIYPDPDPLNPRTEYDNVGHLICWHRRYTLGDEHSYADPDDFFEDLIERGLTEDETNRLQRIKDIVYNLLPGPHTGLILSLETEISRLRDLALTRYVLLPVYAYEHGGITLRVGLPFSCPWDSGQVGWIYVDLATAQKEWPTDTIDRATQYLIGEVDTYDLYLTGQAYGYVIADTDGEELEACWDYLGLEYAREDGQHALKTLAESLPLQHELSL